MVTEAIDLTLKSSFAGDSNIELKPVREREFLLSNITRNTYTRVFGRIVKLGDIFNSIRLTNINDAFEVDFIERSNILFDYDIKQEFVQTSCFTYNRIFHCYAPYDEEAEWYGLNDNKCICCGKVMTFFDYNKQDPCMCVPCSKRLFEEKFEIV